MGSVPSAGFATEFDELLMVDLTCGVFVVVEAGVGMCLVFSVGLISFSDETLWTKKSNFVVLHERTDVRL